MEYYIVVANYTGRLTFMWSGKFNIYCLESQGIINIKPSGNPVIINIVTGNSINCTNNSIIFTI